MVACASEPAGMRSVGAAQFDRYAECEAGQALGFVDAGAALSVNTDNRIEERIMIGGRGIHAVIDAEP